MPRAGSRWVVGVLAAVGTALQAVAASAQVRPAMPVPTPIQGPPRSATTPATGTALIVGQVVDGSSGRPIGGALVTLNLSSPTAGGGLGPPARSATPTPGQATFANSVGRVLADGEGHFVFHDLPAGRATLTATAAGYASGSVGARRPGDAPRPLTITDGERTGDATIRLWKMGTLAGTIVDESGEPLVGVSVNALRLTLMNGTRRPTGGPSATTDDRGTYHFLLSPGDYLVAVSATSSSVPYASVQAFQQALSQPGGAQDLVISLAMSGSPMPTGAGYDAGGGMQFMPGGAMSRNAPPVLPNRPLVAYRTTYYPEAFTSTQAQVITLPPGEDHGNVDITMRLVPTARVLGTVVGPEGMAANLALRLVPTEGPVAFNPTSATATTVSDPSGAFTFIGVPAGQYELQVTRAPRPGPPAASPPAPTYWARMPVSVEGTDVAGLAVVLRLGVRVSGRVEYEGTTARPAADQMSAMTISLVDIDGQGQPVAPTRVAADGTFTTAGVVPGRYLLSVGRPGGSGWMLKAVMANGRDLSAAPQMLDTDLTGALATFTDHPNEVTVSVDAPLTPVPDDSPSVVVFFPANYQAWLAGGTAGRQSRLVGPTQDGHVTLNGLPAGDYLFAAIPSELSGSWQDPKTLEAIASGATHVTIGDSDHKTVELRPLTIR